MQRVQRVEDSIDGRRLEFLDGRPHPWGEKAIRLSGDDEYSERRHASLYDGKCSSCKGLS